MKFLPFKVKTSIVLVTFLTQGLGSLLTLGASITSFCCLEIFIFPTSPSEPCCSPPSVSSLTSNNLTSSSVISSPVRVLRASVLIRSTTSWSLPQLLGSGIRSFFARFIKKFFIAAFTPLSSCVYPNMLDDSKPINSAICSSD